MSDHSNTSTEKQERISVIVPVYNAAETLPRCMRSLLGQTWQNLEILLIDDASSDGSAELCDRYMAADSRVRSFHVSHGGVAAARNFALGVFTGDYLMFADADDLVDPHYAEYLCRALQLGGTPLAYSSAEDFEGGAPEEYRAEMPDGFREDHVSVIPMADYNYVWRDSHRVVWGAIFRRSILEGLTFSLRYAVSTDTLFMAQVLHRCREVTFLTDRLYAYVLTWPTVSRRPYDRIRYDDVRVWEEVAHLFSDMPGAPAESARICRDEKYRSFLLGMAREPVADRKLLMTLCLRIRFRHRYVFAWKKSRRRLLKELLFVSFPEIGYLRVRHRHRSAAGEGFST